VAENILARLFEYDEWATCTLLRACRALDDVALGSMLHERSEWTVRRTLAHIVECQRGYLCLLGAPAGDALGPAPSLRDLEDSARATGAGLRALATGETAGRTERFRTDDGYAIEPWVVLVQAVQHAIDHRRQVQDRLRALGIEPPRLDGWAFGEAVGAVERAASPR